MERAALVRPDLHLSAAEMATIVAICQRLDGIPLAIELAAARMRGMTPSEILERLKDRFRLLTSRSTTTSQRHQTLQAAVTWSYELLTEPERILFRRLSVFSGGWQKASAEAVCAEGFADDSYYLADLVLALVDKSLVLVYGQNKSRYGMLETLREYGREKLAEAGELAVRTGDPARAEELLDEVVTIARQTGDTGLATYGLLSAIPLLVDSGRIADTRDRWLTAYQQTGPADSAVLQLALLGYAAAIAAARGRSRQAVVLTEIALGLLSETGWRDDTLLAWFWRTVAPGYETLGETDVNGAREEGQRKTLDAALSYAASDDD